MKRFVARSARGFTLVEIAVVLVIIGLITAGILALFTSILKSSKSRVAAENATVVQQSLERFVERNGRLPCPADPTLAPGAPRYGVEDVTGCTTATVLVPGTGMARGVVPWISLGLPLEQVQDGYAHMFTYNVTITATQTTAATVSATRGNMTIHTATPTVMGLPPVGNQINSCWIGGAPPPASTPPENSCNMNAVVVLISHGENGFGAFTSAGGQVTAPTAPAEIENTDANVAFVKGDPTASGYDDVVFAWSPDDLFEPLARQGTLRSAAATTNESLRNMALAISTAMVNASGPPPVPPGGYVIAAAPPAPITLPLPNDAWGNPILYAAPNVGSNICGPGLPAAAVAFTLTSTGIDGFATTNPNTNRNDDLILTVPVDQIRNQIVTRYGSC